MDRLVRPVQRQLLRVQLGLPALLGPRVRLVPIASCRVRPALQVPLARLVRQEKQDIQEQLAIQDLLGH